MKQPGTNSNPLAACLSSRQASRPCPKSEKKLFLLDGMALTYRAHFALIRSPRFTSSGMCTSAVFGMVNTLLDIDNRYSPTHIAVAFDTAEPTQRHEEYAEYKAQRDELPEDIEEQLPYIDRLYQAYNIPIIRMPGYEADDIIGTLAYQAKEQGFETWMVTPDKDYHQLVDDGILCLSPAARAASPKCWASTRCWRIGRSSGSIRSSTSWV